MMEAKVTKRLRCHPERSEGPLRQQQRSLAMFGMTKVRQFFGLIFRTSASLGSASLPSTKRQSFM